MVTTRSQRKRNNSDIAEKDKEPAEKKNCVDRKAEPTKTVPECKICLEAYNHGRNRAMVGSCGHTICGRCVRQLARNQRNNTNCPHCRRPNAFQNPVPNYGLLEIIAKSPEDDLPRSPSPEPSVPRTNDIDMVLAMERDVRQRVQAALQRIRNLM